MWPELEAGWSVVGVGDFNGDGISDILVRSDTGYLTDWLGVAGGGFDQNDANAGTGLADNSWQAAGVGNFNNDGHSDILWRNAGGYTTDWLSTQNGGFTDNAAVAGTGAADSSWKIIGIGDFNGDHISDILWRNTNGYITEWLGTSTGAFVSNEANAGTGVVDSTWHVAGIGDFNGDGRSDVLWRNDSGYVTEWTGNANGGFSSNEANAGTGAAPASSTIAGIGDFNGDGKADLLWRASDGTITDWLGQANGGFVDNSAVASQPLDLSLKIDGVGDFDGDGKADVLVQSSDGTLQTWDGSANGAIFSPMVEKLWEDAIANVSQFFDEITNQVDAAEPHGADQGSYYDDGSDYGPMDETFLEMFGWMPIVANDPSAHYWDFLTQDVDPEFQLAGLDGPGFVADFDGHTGSMTSIGDGSDNSFLFDLDGIGMQGVWHEGAPTTVDKDTIIVTGGFWTFDAMGPGSDGQPGGHDLAQIASGSTDEPTFSGPDLHQVNPIEGLTPPDGAAYYVPEGVTAKYLTDALNFLADYAQTHLHIQVLAEFYKLYTDPNDPHFIDFKKWGTPAGPPGIDPVPQITYYSAAVGHNVSASPFEAFGNFFYGLAGRYANISPDELYTAAAWLQTGQTGIIRHDDPQDQPHVNYGISTFEAFTSPAPIGGGTLFSVNIWDPPK